MRTRLRRIWQGSRVSTRIAGAIVLSLFILHLLAVMQFVLASKPQMTIFSLHYLTRVTDRAVATVLATPVGQDRRAALRALDDPGWLDITWQPTRVAPPFDDEAARHPLAERIDAAIEGVLGARASKVIVRMTSPGPMEGPPRAAILFRPPEAEQLLLPAKGQNQPDMPVPGRFTITVQLPDHTWLQISPRDNGTFDGLWYWPLVTLVAGTLIVAALSLATARRILAPLDRLTVAAQRIGTERRSPPIATAGLGEFAGIAEAFNEMQIRLQRFVNERTQMLAAISHDLRTSLTRLKLSIEDLPGGANKEALTKETDEMGAMIASTLSFASSDGRTEASRDLDIASLLISICDEFSDIGAVVNYSGPNHARLSCQPLTLKRAFTNVIDNAIKYGGEARVSLALSPLVAVIGVCDRGPGIPSDKIETAFAPFRRLEESRNRDTGGVGLGLAIARDAILAHGGTVSLENGPEGGLRVMIRLPLTA
jgi:signal transduction histidine kinase